MIAEAASQVDDADTGLIIINVMDERPVLVQMVGRLVPRVKVSLLEEPTFGGGIRTAAPSLEPI